MRKIVRIVLALAILASPAVADVQVKSGASTDTLTVNTNKAALVSIGIPTRVTYYASAQGLTTTSAYSMAIEAAAGTGFKLVGWCVGVSNATAAALVTVTVQRRTTASSGGTQATAEGTSSPAVSKADPADASFGGVVRITGTLGSAGAVLDGQGFTIGEIAAGTADVPSPVGFCRTYGLSGEKLPAVSAGTANGISIFVSAPGSGALASGSISATFIQE